MSQDELAGAVHIDGRLWFCPLRTASGLRTSQIAQSSICYCIDEALVYQPFFADFGPLNLGSTFRFCKQTQELLQEADRTNRRVYYYCGPHAQSRANAAVLVGIYQVIYVNKTADEAFKPLQAFKPYVPFRDASCGVSTFHLTVSDVIKGIQKARDVGFLDWNSGSSNWSLEEYEHYEQVENGDLNWIVPGKLVAFSGPANRGNEIAGYRLHTPEDYWDYYRKKSVTAVVRLNKKVYDRQRFVGGGFRHYDLYFPDGSCPTEPLLLKWLEIAESEPGALAVHCKAGLGRTGVLICCYIMKHFKFTAEEVIGYIRVCRPGSVIGPQQNFLRDVEPRMWHEGDMWRATRGINKPHLALGDLVINGKPVPSSLIGNLPSDSQHSPSTSPALNNYGRSSRTSSTAGPTTHQQPGLNSLSGGAVTNNQHAGTGSLMTRLSGGSSLPVQVSGVNGVQLGPYTSAAVAPAGQGGSGSDVPAGVQQYRQSAGQQSAANLGLAGFSGLTVQVPPPSLSYAASSLTPPASASSTPTSAGAKYLGRSITPLRYAAPGAGYGGGSSGIGTGSIISTAYTGRASSGMMSVTRSTPTALLTRAPSADRAAERSTLRSTLHTDTLRAADRLRSGGDLRHAATSLSADMSLLAGSRAAGPPEGILGLSSPIPTTPKPSAPGHRPNAGVARTLAPNGQPRKIPLAMLPQYHAGMANKPAGAASAGGSIGTAAAPFSPSTPLTQVMSGRAGPHDVFGRAKTAAQMRYSLQSK